MGSVYTPDDCCHLSTFSGLLCTSCPVSEVPPSAPLGPFLWCSSLLFPVLFLVIGPVSLECLPAHFLLVGSLLALTPHAPKSLPSLLGPSQLLQKLHGGLTDWVALPSFLALSLPGAWVLFFLQVPQYTCAVAVYSHLAQYRALNIVSTRSNLHVV